MTENAKSLKSGDVISVRGKGKFIFDGEGGNTKKDKLYHGIGLKSVKQFVENYEGDFSLSFEEGQAIAKIMIKI